MTKRIRINVLERDIERGRRGEYRACPIARALHRHRELRGWGVDWQFAHESTSGTGPLAPLPFAARKFVRDFDQLGPSSVAPISFTLELPEEEQP